MAADHSVSTLLTLSLHPSPGISRSRQGKSLFGVCPSIWCFDPIKDDQEHPVSALSNLKEFTFTLLSPSTLSKPSSVLNLFPVSSAFEDFLPIKNRQELDYSANLEINPSMKRKRQKTVDPRSNKTESDSHSTITSDEGVAKKQRVGKPPTGICPEGDGHWIKKRLSLSDVNDSSRLLLPKEYVKKYVLALMDEERRAACQSTEGLRVKMWDLDTVSEHELSLKQWKTGSFLLTSNWSMEFVKRRNLQEGDRIGLLWNFENLGFFFRKFNAQS